MDMAFQIVISGIVVGAIYGMVALGFTIVFNATRIVNFANGEFVMMGGLISAVLTEVHGIPLWGSLPLAFVGVVLLGMVLERFAIGIARSSDLLTMVMITIGVGIAFRGLMGLVFGKDIHFLPNFGVFPPLVLGGAYVPSQGIWIVLALGLISSALWFVFNRTSVGKAMRASSEDARAAALCGIDPRKMSLLAFAMAAGIGAIAGALIAPMASAFYENGLYLGLKGFAAAVLGGLGNPMGAVVGGLLIGIVENVSAGYLDSGAKDGIAFAILLGFLLLRPGGLLGRVEVWRV